MHQAVSHAPQLSEPLVFTMLQLRVLRHVTTEALEAQGGEATEAGLARAVRLEPRALGRVFSGRVSNPELLSVSPTPAPSQGSGARQAARAPPGLLGWGSCWWFADRGRAEPSKQITSFPRWNSERAFCGQKPLPGPRLPSASHRLLSVPRTPFPRPRTRHTSASQHQSSQCPPLSHAPGSFSPSPRTAWPTAPPPSPSQVPGGRGGDARSEPPLSTPSSPSFGSPRGWPSGEQGLRPHLVLSSPGCSASLDTTQQPTLPALRDPAPPSCPASQAPARAPLSSRLLEATASGVRPQDAPARSALSRGLTRVPFLPP